ncbi:hypothetical protein QQX98_001265 [Neonectria punicea]|uniref:Hsp70 family chaperone n=1 Tax=Neonectria punicea TaxID=979145 RepID=A0ABR1HQ27_9HYPO
MPSSETIRDPTTEVPDLIVGIDFGMTGTAVAFAAPIDQNISVLQQWPGSHLRQDKVPSTIAYRDDMPFSWGFDVSQDMSNARDIKSFFKGVFDEQDLNRVNQDAALSITVGQVEKWLTDYFRQLYAHIKNSLETRLPLGKEWKAAKIRFLFSYPTNWGDETIRRFKRVIEEAGFGQSDGPSSGPHKVEAALDEAHAAMAYYFAESKLPNDGDHLMIADIGGGTSDVSIFLVKGYEDMSPKLFSKVASLGSNIGSTKIDEGFETILRERLALPNVEDANTATLATAVEVQTWKMVEDPAFLEAKCRYGAKPSGTLAKPYFFVTVPVPSKSSSNSHPEIEDRMMKFDKEELFKPLFDDQCSKIWKQFDEQIKKAFPSSDLDEMKLHVVLAGGMGSSEYVKNFLIDKFRAEKAIVPQFAVAQEPQLAVCKGLVHDALKEINQGGLFRYSAQAWYGIAKNNSFQSVEWFLKKDEEVRSSATRDLKRLLEVDDKGKIALQIVKTKEDVQVGLLSKKSKHLNNDPIVVGSLTDKLPPNTLQPHKVLGFQKSKFQVVVKVNLGRGAMKFEISRGKERVGDPLYVSEPWHLTPMLSEGKARGSPRTPRGARIGREKNINWGTIGTWTLGIAAVAATLGIGMAQLKQGDDEEEADEKKDAEEKEAKRKEEEARRKEEEARRKEDAEEEAKEKEVAEMETKPPSGYNE